MKITQNLLSVQSALVSSTKNNVQHIRIAFGHPIEAVKYGIVVQTQQPYPSNLVHLRPQHAMVTMETAQ